MDTDAKLYFRNESDLSYSSSEFETFLRRFCEDFKRIPGIEKTFDPCSAMEVQSNGDTSAIVAPSDKSMKGVTVGGLVGVAIAALFLIFVVVIAARRKQKRSYRYSYKHHQLDEYDDSTYLKDDVDTSSTRSLPRVHVLSDEDSAFTGTNASPRNLGLSVESVSALAGRHDHHDVHICSSATCEICEARRQTGPQFLPAILPSLSYDSISRTSGYVANNTVQL